MAHGNALALDASKNTKEYSKLITVFNEYGEALTAAKRGSEEYRRAQSKIKTALEETYNIEITQKDITLYPMNTIDEIAEVVESKI